MSVVWSANPIVPPELGINLPWFLGGYGHDLGQNQDKPTWPVSYNPQAVGELLDFIADFAVRLVRIWLFEQAEGLIYDQHGRVTDVDRTFLLNLSKLCRQLGDRNFQVYWTLLDANSIYRNNDRVTYSILTDADCADAFGRVCLSKVIPKIKDIAWGIDICNEPEAAITGIHGNGTDRGSSWDEVAPQLEIIATHVRRLCPGISLSIGSGFSEHRNLRDLTAYRRLGEKLDFLDYHTYLPGSRVTHRSSCLAPWNQDRKWIIGEVGTEMGDSERRSRESWKSAQSDLALKLHRLVNMQYHAIFLWYVSTLDDADATSLVYKREAGEALYVFRELAQRCAVK